MLSLVEIKELLSEIVKTFKHNQTVLEDFQLKLTSAHQKLKLYDKYNPRNFPFIPPTQISNSLPKGTISKINSYINRYISYMDLAKEFFTSIYSPMQNASIKSSMMIGEIKATINARLKTRDLQEKVSSDIFYNQRSASVEEKILTMLKTIGASYDEVQTHFADLTQWIIEFLGNDLTYYQDEKSHKTYFSRIYMRLTPTAEVDELAEFSNVSREILQKYLNSSPAGEEGESDKHPKLHVSDISPDNMSLMVEEITLKMDQVHFDKENFKPNPQVSGLVLNVHRIF